MIQVQLKLRPTKAQERTLLLWIWHLTGVWNWAVKKLEANRQMSGFDLKRQVRGHSRKMGIPECAITGTIATAHDAWRRSLKRLAGRPHLKGRRRPLSSIMFGHWADTNRPRVRGGRVYLPGFGAPVRFHRQEIPDGHVGQARLVKRASGWYLCLFVHADPAAVPVVAHGEIGIDPGFSSLLTLSTGEKIERSLELAAAEARIGQAQRGRRTKLAARLAERVRNRRRNRNHHLSRRLVSENDLIAFSADRHSNIARRFGKSVASAGHYQLRQMLAYKSLAGGREYIEVASRNSTRTCSACGGLTGPTGWHGLKVRQWVCMTCGVEHDRDCNAAVNTLVAGRGSRHKNSREAVSGTASSRKTAEIKLAGAPDGQET